MEGAREQEREEVDGLSTRAASWLEWTICALSMALTVLGLWLLVLGLSHPNVPVYSYWAEGTLLAVGYSTVGAVVASPRPGNPVGWALCSIGLSWGRIISAASMSPTHCWQRPGRSRLLKLRSGSPLGFGFRVWGSLCFWPCCSPVVNCLLLAGVPSLGSASWSWRWERLWRHFLRVRGLALAYNLYRKLDAHTRTQAVARARELKLL
jgi:hypothetical protein